MSPESKASTAKIQDSCVRSDTKQVFQDVQRCLPEFLPSCLAFSTANVCSVVNMVPIEHANVGRAAPRACARYTPFQAPPDDRSATSLEHLVLCQLMQAICITAPLRAVLQRATLLIHDVRVRLWPTFSKPRQPTRSFNAQPNVGRRCTTQNSRSQATPLKCVRSIKTIR